MAYSFSSTSVFANQRKSVRVAFKRRARFISTNGSVMQVRTHDLSPEGISIFCPHPLQEGQLCELSIAANCDGAPIDFKLAGRIVYCILSGTLGFRVGVQFGGLSEESKALVERVISRSIPI